MPINLGNRIMIIGSGGSGKSTLARQLGERLKLPVIHLDKEFWNSGWVETPCEEWREKQSTLFDGEAWIADGNYIGGMDLRLERADTAIFLDFGRLVCICSVIKRRLKNRGKTRPDMAEGCPEKIDFEFLKWIWQFPKKTRPDILKNMTKYTGVDWMVVRNRREIKRCLKNF